ncbi:leucine-rich repeat-containing G-protein coupled receptor 5-like [Athalia rosae]|uniref:leucine-rich repeat-containing G-protein coupled receptor 5-like n=1 Tax=Athalia rosae TaxID=37344 RepID=UPI00203347C9|nr:leucine-rich repeat-containing G-protein coupled receptor 5-like [Athalia rosae]
MHNARRSMWAVVFACCFLPAVITVSDRDHRNDAAQSSNSPISCTAKFCLRDSSLVIVKIPENFIEINEKGITGIDPFAFEFCNATEILMMTDNFLTTLSGGMLNGLRSLKVANFFNNKITNIAPRTFDELKELRDLELSQNLLNGLETGVRNGLKKLQNLQLNGNPIILMHDAFTRLPNLRLLELTGARISAIPRGSFNCLDRLQRLDLSWNQLSTIPGSRFEDLTHLEELDLSSNLISSFHIDAFKGLTNVKYLWINENRIGSLGDQEIFKWTPNLITVYLHNNPIRILDLSVFRHMHSVSILPGFQINSSKTVLKNFSNATTTTVNCVPSSPVDSSAPYKCSETYEVIQE